MPIWQSLTHPVDGVHPNSKGHEFVSHIIADFINRM